MNPLVLLVCWLFVFALLAPKVSHWVRYQQLAVERALLKRLESFHIFVQLKSVRLILGVVIVISLVVGVGVFRSIAVTLFAGILSLLGVFWIVRLRLARRTKLIRYQLPGVIELVATSLRSGLSVRSAFYQVANQSTRPISQELAILERMQRIGIPLDAALKEWAKRMPIDEVKLLAFAVGVSAASGGSLSDSLDRLATSWRQHLVLEEKVDALTAQGRLQAWVMAALPMVLAVALTALDPSSMSALWSSSAGHLVLGIVMVFEILGLFWIRRLIRVEA